MNIEEYLDTLKSQIRDTHAKEFVSQEILTHIEDQASDYQDTGMSKDEALQKAVEEMGDPVSVGVDLDRIHRPHLEWKFLLLVLAISLLSITVHFFINRAMTMGNTAGVSAGLSRSHIVSIAAGIFLMLLVYRLDYTILSGKSRLISGAFLICLLFAGLFLGRTINGVQYLGIGSISFSPNALITFYPLLFAGILYEYRGRGKIVLLQIAAWMLAPIVCMILIGDRSLSFYLFLLASEIILFLLAFSKNWYAVKKKALILCCLAVSALIAFFGAFRIMHLADYQSARLQNWLAGLGIIRLPADEDGINYISSRLTKVFSQSNLLSKSDPAALIMKDLPGSRSDLVLGSVAAGCGKLFLLLIVLMLLLLAVYVFLISGRQKNSLGYITGCACGISIGLQSILNLAIVFGLLPSAASILPLFSSGMGYILIDYILLGFILSIYRYKDIRNEKRSDFSSTLS